MDLIRFENNVITGESTSIEQTAYRDGLGNVLVLDSIDPEPNGYMAFDPSEDILSPKVDQP